MKKGISLVALPSREVIKEIIERYSDVCFELPYNMSISYWNENKDLLENRIASIHSLCPEREFFPNFASDDDEARNLSFTEVLKDRAFASSVSADFMVIHPGYLYPGLVSSESEKRMRELDSGKLDSFRLKARSTICNKHYIESSFYRDAFDRMKRNLEIISSEVAASGSRRLCAENLNPRVGYMLMTPDEIVEIAGIPSVSLCLDIGHLKVSSALFGFDFISALRRVLDTFKVVTTHLHSNPSGEGRYEDSHESLDKYSMPYKKVLDMIEEHGANMILETVEDPVGNLSLIFP